MGKKKLLTYEQVKTDPQLLPDFVGQMTTEELARLNVCASGGWGMEEKGEAGRLYCLEAYGMQDYIMADGSNGVNLREPNIGMPVSTVVCQSFHKRLSYEVGLAIAKEARELGVHMILAPAVNLHRNPLAGRNAEYFSEDPVLAGLMGGYYGKGLEEGGVSSCVKHVAANNCEAARKRNQSIVTERALREIYLKVFEVILSVYRPAAMMTSYNALNGRYPAADEELLQGVFREEFGFDGFFMSDWESYETVDPVEMAAAGNSLITPGTLDDQYVAPLVRAVSEGRLTRERLKQNAAVLLRAVVNRHRSWEKEN